MKKIAVIGSRSFSNYEYLKSILQWHEFNMIISGGAKGADSLAQRYATEHNVPFKCFNADWDAYGKAAGPIRNKQIIDECDEVIAFWDNVSKGTKLSINLAKEQNKPVHIYWPTQNDIADQILQKIG